MVKIEIKEAAPLKYNGIKTRRMIKRRSKERLFSME